MLRRDFEAQSYLEERRRGFLTRHGINLKIKLHNFGETKSSWEVVGPVDEAMTRVLEIQNRLSSKAFQDGLPSLSDSELLDYMDVEELHWFLNSRDIDEFVASYAPAISAITGEIHRRGIKVDPSGR